MAILPKSPIKFMNPPNHSRLNVNPNSTNNHNWSMHITPNFDIEGLKEVVKFLGVSEKMDNGLVFNLQNEGSYSLTDIIVAQNRIIEAMFVLLKEKGILQQEEVNDIIDAKKLMTELTSGE